MKHKKIYLQAHGNEEEGITWCQDKINDDDIEYILANEIAALEAELAAAKQERDKWQHGYTLSIEHNAQREEMLLSELAAVKRDRDEWEQLALDNASTIQGDQVEIEELREALRKAAQP